MRFDREDYRKAKNLATFEYMGETFRIVRRRFGSKHWRKELMVLHGNAPISNDSCAWSYVTDPVKCAKLTLAYMTASLTTREELNAGLAVIHGTPNHGGRPNPDVTEF